MTESDKMTVARAVELLRGMVSEISVTDDSSRLLVEMVTTVCDALEWRPIETAPKLSHDGRQFGPDLTLCEGERVFDAAWFVREDGSFCGWYIYDYAGVVDCNPTHWRPLPEPPA